MESRSRNTEQLPCFRQVIDFLRHEFQVDVAALSDPPALESTECPAVAPEIVRNTFFAVDAFVCESA